MSYARKILKNDWRENVDSEEETLDKTIGCRRDLGSYSGLQRINSGLFTELKMSVGNFSRFNNLVSLILQDNSLQNLPPEIKQLRNLKHLDVAYNRLSKLPAEISYLTKLVSLNANYNQLTEIPSLENSKGLRSLNLSFNLFEEFPNIIYENMSIIQLCLNYNKIKQIPASIGRLSTLIILYMSHNLLQSLPSEVGYLDLIDIDIEGNQFGDIYLNEFISLGDHTDVFQYIRRVAMIQSTVGEAPIANNNNNNSNDDDSEEESEEPVAFTKFIRCEMVPAVTVFRLEKAARRQFILCCVVRNVHFTYMGFRNIFRLQNMLHGAYCDNRNIASIGIHDFDLFANKSLTYTSLEPSEIIFRPVGSDTYISAEEYFFEKKLEATKNKKKDQLCTPFIRCLTDLETAPTVPVLMTTEDRQVVSIPPIITSCEDYRVTEDTRTIFIEVTSQHSFVMCKKVIEQLIFQLLNLGICDEAGHANDNFDIEQHYIFLTKVRICNSDGSYCTEYPRLGDLPSFGRDVKIVYEF